MTNTVQLSSAQAPNGPVFAGYLALGVQKTVVYSVFAINTCPSSCPESAQVLSPNQPPFPSPQNCIVCVVLFVPPGAEQKLQFQPSSCLFLFLTLNQAEGEREDRKDRDQLRDEEGSSDPKLLDFFCSLLPFFANRLNYCLLSGSIRGLPRGRKSCFTQRKEEPKVLLWLVKATMHIPLTG